MPQQFRGLRWVAWITRVSLVGPGGLFLIAGDRHGLIVSAIGTVLSLAPPAIGRLAGRQVPVTADLVYTFSVGLQAVSDASGLFDLLPLWDKLVHPTELLLLTFVATLPVLGHRERRTLDIPDNVLASWALFFGDQFGYGVGVRRVYLGLTPGEPPARLGCRHPLGPYGRVTPGRGTRGSRASDRRCRCWTAAAAGFSRPSSVAASPRAPSER